MENEVIKVESKLAAIEAIESEKVKVVELNYELGALDVLELGRLGRKFRVVVQYIAQEAIRVKSEFALKRNLSEPKDTFKQRFLHLEFDLDAGSISEYQTAASRMGDMIIPKGFEPRNTTTWE